MFCYLAADEPDHLSLGEIMVFFSGCDKVPPLGFDFDPSTTFDEGNVYPTASTCALSLVLPTRYQSYDAFKEKVTFGFKNYGGFGLL